MFTEWANIFADGVVEVVRRLYPRFHARRARIAFPSRFFADLFFAVAVFFLLNRRVLSTYHGGFWSQFLYLLQFLKVIYTLRYLLAELAFRELKTFLCFLQPVLSKNTIIKQWQKADPCVMRVANLALFFVFIGLNFLLAYAIESFGWAVWQNFQQSKEDRKPLIVRPRRPTRKKRYRRMRERYDRRQRRRAQNSDWFGWFASTFPWLFGPNQPIKSQYDSYDSDSDNLSDLLESKPLPPDNLTDSRTLHVRPSHSTQSGNSISETSGSSESNSEHSVEAVRSKPCFIDPVTRRRFRPVVRTSAGDIASSSSAAVWPENSTMFKLRTHSRAKKKDSYIYPANTLEDSREFSDCSVCHPSYGSGNDYWRRTRSGREF